MNEGIWNDQRAGKPGDCRHRTKSQADFPPFLRDMLAHPPQAGTGVHHWLFRVARQLHAHLPAAGIIALLQHRVANCGRPVPRPEIVAAVQSALACAWQPQAQPHVSAPPSPRWPAVDHTRRQAVLDEGRGLADLWERSNPRLDDNAAHTEEIIDRLFPGNPLLCCGRSSRVFDTRPREAWRGELSRLALIVPSPMSAVTGVTKNGRESAHTLANTGARRFLICEFDTGTADEHAAVLLHLGQYAPLVCAVHSGGKSLHGWFLVDSQPDALVEHFFRYAVALGADPATWTRSQFVRLPDGRRDNGNRQTVYFLNYQLLQNRP